MRVNERMKKVFSILLCLCMVLQYVPTTAFAAEAAESGLCEHHTEHTAECGYAEAVAGSDCTHSHDELCGYAEAVTEVLCACEATDENGALVHTEGCGYVAPVEGSNCTHVHDDACGYVASVSGSVCTYHCHICHVQEMVHALPGEVTAENAEAVAAQLTVIDNEKVSLSDEELAQVDFTKYTAAAEGLGSVYNVVPIPETTTYTVNIADGIENGIVAADVTEASEGETVTLTVTANEGFVLDALTVTAENATAPAPVEAEGKYTFTMPAGNVTISATFKEVASGIQAGYYLVGTLNGKNKLSVDQDSSDRLLKEDTNVEGQYCLEYTFAAGDKLKIAYFDGQEITKWYKDDDFYPISDAKAGKCILLFRPEGNDIWSFTYFTVTPVYSVTVNTVENGAVTADKAVATADETVTLKVTPAEGYEIDTVSYNDGADHTIAPVEGVYSFTMPAGDVTVTATFKIPVCTCTDKCAEGSPNSECAVCSTDLTACIGGSVAKVGNTYYTDFATAVANWTDNTTLTLLADVTDLAEQIELSGNGLVLDLNGKSMETSIDYALTVTGGKLTIRDNVGTGSFTTTADADVVLLVDDEDAVVDFESGTLGSVYVRGGTFNMTGGKIYSEWIGISYFSNGTVNVSGGEVMSTQRDGIYNLYGTLTVTGTAKITSENGYAIRNSSASVLTTISGDVALNGLTGELYLGKAIVLNTQPTGDTKWDVNIDTSEYTGIENGVFAIPGDGVTLDPAKFTSLIDGYEVKLNNKNELVLCNHSAATVAVSNGNGTHNTTCDCNGTTFESNISCSGGVATATHLAVCAYCGGTYGELDANVNYDIIATAMTAAELKDAVTAWLADGNTDISILLTAYADQGMFTAIWTAFSESTAADGSINLTISGAKTVPEYGFFDNDNYFENGEKNIAGDKLKSLTLTDVETIGDCAFSACTYLESVNLPQVVTVGFSAFNEWKKGTKLTSLDLPNATTIGNWAFAYSSLLTSVNLPKVVTIGTVAFADCDLRTLDLPEATTIGGEAFMNNDNLVSCSAPKATTIGYHSWGSNGTSKLERLELTAVGDFTLSNNIIAYTPTEQIDLVLNKDKETQVTQNEDGTATWATTIPYGDSLTYTFKSITLTCVDGTTNHSYTYTDQENGTHKAECTVEGCGFYKYEAHTPAENATYTDKGDGTHSYTCTVCGDVTEDHTLTDGACNACDYVCPHSNFDSATGNCKDCETSLAIAKIKTGETTIYYQTADDLRNAVLESGDDQTLTLLADFAVIGDLNFQAGGTENTLDLNGHTLVSSDPIGGRILVNYCKLTITGTGSINIFMGADSEGAKIVVGSGVTLNNSLRSAYGGVLDLTNATIPEAGLNVILYSDDWDPTTYNVSDVLLLPADYYFFVGGKAAYTYSGETEGTVLKHTEHSYTYTDNGDGTHDKVCSVCGDVIVDNQAHHGTATYAVNAEDSTKHDVTYSCCGVIATEGHNFENDAHQCICGKVETFNVYWALSNSLMQSTSTYGQDFTQTFNVPENTHLEIYGVHLEDDSTVPVNYTYENGVLTIAAADLPAADVYIDCHHYIEVKFHANGGVIKPHDGYPVPGDTGIAEDGSYWIHKFAVGQEIDNFANAEMSRTGYTFVEWRDASGKLYPMNVPGRVEPYILATEDVTLYAQWQCNHTIGGVVFRDNGDGTHNGYCGECGEPLGNYVERPHAYDETTHQCVCGVIETFAVTVYDGNENIVVSLTNTTATYGQDFTAELTSDAEVQPHYELIDYTVNDETYEDAVYENGKLTIPAANITGDIEVWVNPYVIVTIYGNGGLYQQTEPPIRKETWVNEYRYGNEYNFLSEDEMIREGYEFVHFTTEADGTGIVYKKKTNYAFAEDLDLYAQWEVNTYTYQVETYTMDAYGNYGEPVTEERSAAYGTSVNAAPTSLAEGFYLDEAHEESHLTAMVPANDDLVLKVYIGRSQYPITWDLNGGGTYYNDLPESKYYGISQLTVFDDFVKEGHTFSHLEDASGSRYVDASPNSDCRRFYDVDMPVGGMTLKAIWTVNAYALHVQDQTLDVDYGTALADALADITPEKTGHTFTGWTYHYLDEDDVEQPYTGTTMPAVELYAEPVYEAIQYNITWDMAGCSYYVSNYDGLPTKLAYNVDGNAHNVNFTDITAPEGYEFVRFEDGDGNALSYVITDKYRLNLTVSGDMTVKAVIEPKTYKATWVSFDGSSRSVNVKYGETITVCDHESIPGYTFLRWEGYTEDMTMPAKDVTFTAIYQVNQYTITFNTDGGSEVAPITQDYGTAVTAPAAPSRDGYHFVEWLNLPATMPAENVTIKAVWEAHKDHTYSASGNTITAKCGVCGEVVGTVSITAESKTYDGTPAVVDYHCSGVVDPNEVGPSFTKDGRYVNGEDLAEEGAYTASITLGMGEDAATASVDFTIAKKELTATVSGSMSKSYDGTNAVPERHSLNIVLNGVISGDTVTASADFAFAGVNAGTTTINATNIALSGKDAANYELKATTASADVGEIVVLDLQYLEPHDYDIVFGTEPVYNGKEQTMTVESFVMCGLDVTYELTGNTGTDAGFYTMVVTANGNFAGTITQDWQISRKAVTVTAEDQTITYGETISGTEITADGLVDGHSVTMTLTPSTANVTANGTITASAAAITADGTDVTDNYEITYTGGKLVIEPDTSRIDTLSTENVTSANEEDIKAVQEMMEDADSTKEEWETIPEKCEALLDRIAEVEAEQKEATNEAATFDEDTVNSADKENLEQLAKDIENLLDTDNLTEDEREALETVLEQVEGMIDTIEDTAEDSKAATEKIDALDPATVTSDDKDELEQAIETIDKLLTADHLTEEERSALEDARADAEALIERIETAQDATDTENTEKVEDVTADNVKPEDKEALEDAKADLEKALEDNADNYTEEEKQAIQDEIQRIDDAMVALENVEDVTDSITQLPETVEPDDEETAKKILDDKEAYDELTDHEKSLVDETTKKKLDDLVAALTAYDIIKGDGGKWTKGGSTGLTFTANGPFSKFVGIEVDGKEVDEKYYDAKAGSTIITLKQSYLKRLSTGEHTITVLYTDGETSGTFKILAASSTPATGDNSNIMLYSSMFTVSLAGLVVLLLAAKKRKQENA